MYIYNKDVQMKKMSSIRNVILRKMRIFANSYYNG